MNDDIQSYALSDETLVAYIDDRLDPQERSRIEAAIYADAGIAERFDYLSRSQLPFKQAFDCVLDQAPMHTLQTMLAGLPMPRTAPPLSLSRRGFVAAAAGLVIAGVVADRVFLDWRTPTTNHGWRALVAEYMALYTPQTLDNLSSDPALQSAQLASVNLRLGLSLDAFQLALPGPEFKRAQILEYDGVPIAQITYLDPEHGPLALCITHSSSGQTATATEQRLGMNVVFWSDSRHAFMLIGHNTADQLGAMAKLIQQRLTA